MMSVTTLGGLHYSVKLPNKVFCRVIQNRMKKRVDCLLRESQCGFRKGRGCADQIFSVRGLMEKAREFKNAYLPMLCRSIKSI